jgi:hypothetical protein
MCLDELGVHASLSDEEVGATNSASDMPHP